MSDQRRGIAVALVAAGVSGVAVFVNGLAVRRFDDTTVYTTAKNLVAGVLLLGVLVTFAPRASAEPSASRSRRSSWALVAIAVVGGSVPFVLFFEGLARASSGDAAFIHKTLVVWVALGATAVLRERFTVAHAAAIALLLAGHAVLAGGFDDLAPGRGELYIFAATLLWSVEVLIAKPLLGGIRPQVAATVRMAGGCVVLVGWLAVTARLDDLARLGGDQVWWVLLTGSTLAVFVSAWYTALALAPAIDVTAVLVLGAVFTGLLNVVFRGAPVTGNSLGWVLIAGAVGVVATVSRSGADRPSPLPTAA